MTTALVTTAPNNGALTEAQAERIEEALENAYSPNTLRNYQSQWATFEEWCGQHGHCALPCPAGVVAAFIAERAHPDKERIAVGSLRMAAASIAHKHKQHGYESPTANQGVRDTLRGIAREQAGRGQRQAAPLTREAVAAILATNGRRREGPSGRRESEDRAHQRFVLDRALVLCMRDALLRRSEAAELQWADIEYQADGTGRLLIRKSKSDAEGHGHIAFLSVEAVNALRELFSISPEDDRVFCLTAGAISNRLTRAAKEAGLTGAFSGHSARTGMAVDLATHGFGLVDIQTAGRWKSPSMPGRYCRGVAAGKNAVARFHGQ